MYRYAPHMRNTQSGSRMKDTIRNVVIVLLVIAVGVLGYLTWRSTAYERDAHTLFVQRIQVECNNALTLTNSLSRTAGASSSSTLGKIRSHVYSMETINTLNVGLSGAGGYMISEGTFTDLYSAIDDYANKLITGATTGDVQTSLLSLLTELQLTVEALR